MAPSSEPFAPVLVALISVVLYVIYGQIQQRRIPKGLPWCHRDPRVSMTKSKPEMLMALKEHYTDKGLRFVFKSSFAEPKVVLLPSDIPWIVSQSESILSHREMLRQELQSDWNFLDSNIIKHPIHKDVVSGNMIRNLDSFTQPIMEEIRLCFEEYWGTSTEWHEVNVFQSMLKLFARTSNRMFVGLPLCRNEEYLDACQKYTEAIVVATISIKVMPSWLKPVFGYLAIAPEWWQYRKAAKYLLPLIESRMASVTRYSEKEPAKILPDDFITWSIVHALEASDPKERTPELIAKRTMTTHLAAIHTTTLTTTNLLLDLLGSDPDSGYIEALTAEVEAINTSNYGDWSKSALTAMIRTDSALRESMRLSGFVVWALVRKIVAEDGVTMPDGTRLPYGANIAVPAYSTHHDRDIYEEPFEYDAFRFSRQREDKTGGSREVHGGDESSIEAANGSVVLAGNAMTNMNVDGPAKTGLREIVEMKNLAAVTVGPDFMHFGHGKFTCPGRFFAVQEIKLLMAYMLLNYDIKHLPSRPKQKWYGPLVMPDTSTMISVRRKVDSAKA